MKPRTLLTIVAGAIAAYVLLSPAGQPDLVGTPAPGRLALGARRAGALGAHVRGCVAVAVGLRAGEALAHPHLRRAARGRVRHARVAAHGRRGRRQRALPAEVRAAPGAGRRERRRLAGVRVLRAHRCCSRSRRCSPARTPTSASSRPRAAIIIGVVVVVALGLLLLFGPVRKTILDARPADPQRGRPTAAHRGPAPLEDRRGHRRHPAAQRRVRAVHDRLLRGVRRRGQPELGRHRAGLPRGLHPRSGRAHPRWPRCRGGGVRRGPHPRRASTPASRSRPPCCSGC